MGGHQQLLELIRDNPNLPVVPLVSGEIAGDDYGYWLGAWDDAFLSEYIMTREGDILFARDGDVYGDLEKYLSINDFDALPEDDAECRQIWGRLPWREAIIVLIDPPKGKEG